MKTVGSFPSHSKSTFNAGGSDTRHKGALERHEQDDNWDGDHR